MRSFILRRIVFIAAVLLIPAAVLVTAETLKNNAVECSASVTNWGLSFGQEGSCPISNMSKEELKKFNAVFVGDESKKTIYITFDAGYEAGYTAKILDTLKKHSVPATFFVVGNYLETAPELVKRMCDEGHIVANHTYTHPDMSAISSEANFKSELKKVEEKYNEITGGDMLKLYRPPQGKFCEENLIMAQKLDYKTVFWSLAYVDWLREDQPTKEEAFSKLIPRIHNGAIVLLHSTSKTNSEILDELLSKYESMGYSFGKISDL